MVVWLAILNNLANNLAAELNLVPWVAPIGWWWIVAATVGGASPSAAAAEARSASARYA